MIPANHPLAREPGNTVRLEQLAGERLFVPTRSSRHEAVIRWFSDIGKEANIVGTLSSFESSYAIARTGAGISIFPQTIGDPLPNVTIKIISEPIKKAEYYLVWNKSQPQRDLIEQFINYVKDYTAQMNRDGRMNLSSDHTRIPETASLL